METRTRNALRLLAHHPAVHGNASRVGVDMGAGKHDSGTGCTTSRSMERLDRYSDYLLRRVKLITETGQKPTWRQVVVRLVGAVLSAAALGIGYAWRAVPPSRRYWHDTLSGTHLELMPKRE